MPVGMPCCRAGGPCPRESPEKVCRPVRAAIYHTHGGSDVLQVVDVPTPEPATGQVLVAGRRVQPEPPRPAAAAGPGADPGLLPAAHRRHGRRRHRGGGRPGRPAGGPEGIAVGDRVVVNPAVGCGSAPACLLGADGKCEVAVVIGGNQRRRLRRARGGAGHQRAPDPRGRQLRRRSRRADGVDDRLARAARGRRAAARRDRPDPRRGQRRQHGRDPARQGGRRPGDRDRQHRGQAGLRARASAPTSLVNSATDDITKAVREATDGRGVEVVLDHVGPAVWDASIYSLAPRGRMVFVGNTTGNRAEFDLVYAYHFGLRLLGSDPYDRHEFPTMLAALLGVGLRDPDRQGVRAGGRPGRARPPRVAPRRRQGPAGPMTTTPTVGPGAVWDVINGYAAYWAVAAASDLGIFDRLAAGPAAMPGEELAAAVGAAELDPVVLLADTLVALGLLTTDGAGLRPAAGGGRVPRHRLTEVDGVPGTALARSARGLAARWRTPSGPAPPRSASTTTRPRSTRRSSVRPHPPSGRSRPRPPPSWCGRGWLPVDASIVDLGAGSGAWVAALLAAQPASRAVAVDLPEVAGTTHRGCRGGRGGGPDHRPRGRLPVGAVADGAGRRGRARARAAGRAGSTGRGRCCVGRWRWPARRGPWSWPTTRAPTRRRGRTTGATPRALPPVMSCCCHSRCWPPPPVPV